METENAIEAERRFLLEQITHIRQQFEKAAKPYMDRLVQLERIHGNRHRFVITGEQWKQLSENFENLKELQNANRN